MNLAIVMVADTPGTVTNATDVNQWEAHQLPHPLLAMEVTEKGIALLEQYVAAVREAVGMEIPLAMDHLGHLGVKSIIRLGKAYEKYNLSWIEDVIPWTYTDLLRQISEESPTPILTGEDIYLKEPFQVLCEKRAVSKIQPDLATAGGILETHKIGDLAQEYGVPMALHFAGTPVCCMANVHCAFFGPGTPLPRRALVVIHRARRSQNADRQSWLDRSTRQARPRRNPKRKRSSPTPGARHRLFRTHSAVGQRTLLGPPLELGNAQPVS